MKNVLFIGVTEYDFGKDNPHLEKKFLGLSEGMKVFVIARGKLQHKHTWNTDFYLIPVRLFFLPLSFVLGCYVCISKKIDVIVCQTPLTEGLVGAALKKFFGKELIIEVHGDWEVMPFVSRKRTFSGLLKRVVPVAAKASFKNADKIRTLTTVFSEKMKEITPGKQHFIFPTFTDIDYFLDESNTQFKKYIVTVAVLSPIKGIGTLIDAFSTLRHKFPDFKLIIVGDGPSLENLKLKVKDVSLLDISHREKKLEDVVIFTGRLPVSEVRKVMKDCYLFVLPSLSEGFGRVFIEAMALGKPVIGTNVGGIPEIIKNGVNGFLIDPKNVGVLAERIEDLLSSPELAKRLGESGREFVQENFSNTKYIQNYINMINA